MKKQKAKSKKQNAKGKRQNEKRGAARSLAPHWGEGWGEGANICEASENYSTYKLIMKKFKADIIVKLKNGIRDPQGHAIETVLKRKNFDNAPKVDTGKFFSVEIEGENEVVALEKTTRIAQEVLSNPVLETYEIVKVIEL